MSHDLLHDGNSSGRDCNVSREIVAVCKRWLVIVLCWCTAVARSTVTM